MDTLISTLGLDDFASPAPDARLVTATVTAANADAALASFTLDGAKRVGLLPLTEFIPGRSFEVGQSLTTLLVGDGEHPVLSMTRPEIVGLLLAGVSPEVRTGSVRVMAVARRAGMRTKVAVAATEVGVDPIAACVGRTHNRVDQLKAAFLGEQVDVVAWHADKETFLRNALQPASVSKVEFDESGRNAIAYVPGHQMSAAVGGGGLNSALAGQLVGVMVRIAQG